jgi:hypothetical protein
MELVMAVLDLFSKRQRRARGDVPDVLVGGPIPSAFRAQVIHIWREFWPDSVAFVDSDPAVTNLRDRLAREQGTLLLRKKRGTFDSTARTDLFEWLLHDAADEHVLDAIEASIIDIRNGARLALAIDELNQRFLEHGLGYEFDGKRVIVITDRFVHREAVKEALLPLSDPAFEGAEHEFRGAFEHFRHGRHEPAILDACKAFESMMKAICNKRSWDVDPKAAAAALVKNLITNNLLHEKLEAPLNSGLPPIRNAFAGHGAGATPRTVDRHIAAYALHLAASNLVLLGQADRAMGWRGNDRLGSRRTSQLTGLDPSQTHRSASGHPTLSSAD